MNRFNPLLRQLLSRTPTQLPSRSLSHFSHPQFNSIRSNSIPTRRTNLNSTLSYFTPHVPTTPRSAFSTSAFLRGIRPYYGRSTMAKPGSLAHYKNQIDRFNSMNLVYALIALNLSVFASWSYYGSIAQRFRDNTGLVFMNNHFTSSLRNLKEGRIWTLLTSCFSQNGTSHLLINMASLYFLAPTMMAGALGNTGFLALYLFSGIAANIASLTFNQISQPNNPYFASHGASGAVYGCLSYFAATNPRATFLIFFVIPAPAWLCVSGLFAYDAYSALSRTGGKTDSAGHAGGVIAGLLFFARRAGRMG